MKVLLNAFLPVLLVCATYSVSYGNEYDNDDTSWYLGVLGLRTFENFDASGFDDVFGIGAKFGVRFDTPSDEVDLALELNLNWYDTFEIEGLGGWMDIDMSSLTVRPKLYVSGIAEGRFEPYVYLGAGYMVADIDAVLLGQNFILTLSGTESAFIYEGGVGLEVSITDTVGLFTEASYVETTGDLDGFSHLTVGAGVVLRF